MPIGCSKRDVAFALARARRFYTARCPARYYLRTVMDLLQTRRVFLIILALGLFTMAARSATDPDLWWHLRTGQLVVQTHAVFHTDPYSFTRSGQPWIDHEWLSQVFNVRLVSARRVGWTHCRVWRGHRDGVHGGFLAVSGAALRCWRDHVIGRFCLRSELGRSTSDAYLAAGQRASPDPRAFL